MRVGLFLSRCGGILEETLDLPALARRFSGEGKTLVVESFQNSADIATMLKVVKEERLEGVVLAGNSPEEFKTTRHGELLADLFQDAGINPNRIAYVNLKEQVAQVHRPGPAAWQKAELLIRVGITRVKLAHDMQVFRVAPRKAVAIIGTNEEAFLAAEQLVKRDIRVYIIGWTPAQPQGMVAPRRQEFPDALAGAKAFVELSSKVQFLDGFQISDIYG